VSLRERIAAEIREHGPIPFSRYMQLCLYEPELGYYSRSSEQFGKAGDFYTSSDVHAVFGRLLARQFDEMWRAAGSQSQIRVLELGPGRGLFAQDVLDWEEKKFPDFFAALRYELGESSPALWERLKQTLSRRFESGKCRFAELPFQTQGSLRQAQGRLSTSLRSARDDNDRLTEANPAIVFANEFFDALPVEVLSDRGALRIGLQGERFVESWASASESELGYMDRWSVHPEAGERVEVALASYDVAREVASTLDRGFFIAIDYGYTRDELLAGRHRGTIMTYRQHSASPNPYEAPGEQDITAHVNFTALADALETTGMRTEKLLTQSQFLMGIGEANEFADAFEECRLPQERAKVALQLKHLVTPAGMGETFHVLVASKGVEPGTVVQLSGLKFDR
jgi:SAM-dependent MidA family methyltransferase